MGRTFGAGLEAYQGLFEEAFEACGAVLQVRARSTPRGTVSAKIWIFKKIFFVALRALVRVLVALFAVKDAGFALEDCAVGL